MTGPLHFGIGVVPVSVGGEHPEALRDFQRLYAAHQRPEPEPGSIRIDVIRRRRWGIRWGYEVWSDGSKRFALEHDRAVLPHLEWAINWQVMLHLPRFLEVHAAVLEVDGKGVIFPAAPGSGKTTLAAALTARGWRYLSDEFALIDPLTLHLHPYPKALCIKEGSFFLFRALGLGEAGVKDYVKGRKGRVRFVPPTALADDAVGRGDCPIRSVVFCRYEPDSPPSLQPIPRADAVLRLRRQALNFAKFGARGIDVLSAVVRGAQCYELTAGPIQPTCDLLDLVLA